MKGNCCSGINWNILLTCLFSPSSQNLFCVTTKTLFEQHSFRDFSESLPLQNTLMATHLWPQQCPSHGFTKTSTDLSCWTAIILFDFFPQKHDELVLWQTIEQTRGLTPKLICQLTLAEQVAVSVLVSLFTPHSSLYMLWFCSLLWTQL